MTLQMAVGDKPYRLYKGGRTKGKVPLERRTRGPGTPGTPAAPDAPRRRRWGLWIALGLVGLILLFVLWAALGFLSFSRGVHHANDRLPRNARRQLAEQQGSLLSSPTTILLMGTDGGEHGRAGSHRSDS